MELLSGLRDEDLIRVVAGQAELVEARLPRRVGFTMRERLRSVSAPAREAATVAASLGRRFSFADLAHMLDRSPATLLGPVEELIDCGMLVESGDRLAFRHDVTREAVRESVPVSARRALDRQAADVLLAAGAAPVEVAAQIAASAEPGDEQAISILLRAGEALATTDPGAGADLSRRALELAPRDHDLRGPLLAQTAVLLHSAGRVDEARAFADTQLRDALPAEQEAEVLLSIAGMFRVPPDARVAAGRQALALPELPAHLRAQHLAALFHNLLVGGRAEEAKAIRAETAEAVKASGDANSAFAFALAETRYRLSRRALRRCARDDRAGGARRDRHDRLGPGTPRAGVALRDAHRGRPGGRITAAGRRRRRRRAARPKRLGRPHLRDLAGTAAAPAGPTGRRRRDPRGAVRTGDRRSLHRRARCRRIAPDTAGIFPERLIDEWGFGAPHIVGPDVGIAAALFLAAKAPERVSSLTIGGGAVRFPIDAGGALKDVIEAPSLDVVRALDARTNIGYAVEAGADIASEPEIHEDYVSAYDLGRFAESARFVRHYPEQNPVLRDLLPTVSTPTQVVAGRDDDLVPWSNNEYLNELLPNSELHGLDAGHFAWEQAAEEYGRLIVEWVSGGYLRVGAAASPDHVGEIPR